MHALAVTVDEVDQLLIVQLIKGKIDFRVIRLGPGEETLEQSQDVTGKEATKLIGRVAEAGLYDILIRDASVRCFNLLSQILRGENAVGEGNRYAPVLPGDQHVVRSR